MEPEVIADHHDIFGWDSSPLQAGANDRLLYKERLIARAVHDVFVVAGSRCSDYNGISPSYDIAPEWLAMPLGKGWGKNWVVSPDFIAKALKVPEVSAADTS